MLFEVTRAILQRLYVPAVVPEASRAFPGKRCAASVFASDLVLAFVA